MHNKKKSDEIEHKKSIAKAIMKKREAESDDKIDIDENNEEQPNELDYLNELAGEDEADDTLERQNRQAVKRGMVDAIRRKLSIKK